MYSRGELRLFVREEMRQALESIVANAEVRDQANGDTTVTYCNLVNAIYEEFRYDRST